MPRTARAIEAGLVYHVLNRGNGGIKLFEEPVEYADFEQILVEGLQSGRVVHLQPDTQSLAPAGPAGDG